VNISITNYNSINNMDNNMSSFETFISTNMSGTDVGIIVFHPLSDNDGLPFPLNLQLIWKILLVAILLVNLVQGSRLRGTIVAYIKSPESNLGPINYLIWVDQINGMMYALIVLVRIVYIIYPYPISSIFGLEFCQVMNFVSGIFVAGSYTWGCCVAIFRVLFVTFQNSLNGRIGTEFLLNAMLFLGMVQIFAYSTTSLIFDDEVPGFKMCTHLSSEDQKIFQQFLVIFYTFT
jgi:hypothetical protein